MNSSLRNSSVRTFLCVRKDRHMPSDNVLFDARSDELSEYNGPFWLIEKSKQKFWRLEFNSFEPQIIPNKSSTTLQQKTLYFQRPVFLLMQSQPYFFRKANTQKTRKGGYCLLQFSPFQKGRRNFRDSRLDRRRKKPHRVLAALNPVRRNIIARVFFTQPLNYSW